MGMDWHEDPEGYEFLTDLAESQALHRDEAAREGVLDAMRGHSALVERIFGGLWVAAVPGETKVALIGEDPVTYRALHRWELIDLRNHLTSIVEGSLQPDPPAESVPPMDEGSV